MAISYEITDETTHSRVLIKDNGNVIRRYAYPKTISIRVAKERLTIYLGESLVTPEIPRAFITVPASTSDENLFDLLAFMCSGSSGTGTGPQSISAEAPIIIEGTASDPIVAIDPKALVWKPSVKGASTNDLGEAAAPPEPAIYDNGAGGIGATLTQGDPSQGDFNALGQDGVVYNVGDTILVKNQNQSLENGIYEVVDLGDGNSSPWVLRRMNFYDEVDEIFPLNALFVQEGSLFAKKAFKQINNPSAGTVGTDSIVYEIMETVIPDQPHPWLSNNNLRIRVSGRFFTIPTTAFIPISGYFDENTTFSTTIPNSSVTVVSIGRFGVQITITLTAPATNGLYDLIIENSNGTSNLNLGGPLAGNGVGVISVETFVIGNPQSGDIDIHGKQSAYLSSYFANNTLPTPTGGGNTGVYLPIEVNVPINTTGYGLEYISNFLFRNIMPTERRYELEAVLTFARGSGGGQDNFQAIWFINGLPITDTHSTFRLRGAQGLPKAILRIQRDLALNNTIEVRVRSITTNDNIEVLEAKFTAQEVTKTSI